jgi:ELWxxDGT repeat protein
MSSHRQRRSSSLPPSARRMTAGMERLEDRRLLAIGAELFKDINTNAGGGSSPSEFVDVNGTLFFSAYSPSSGNELWKSNGTPAGTVLVANIRSGSSSSYPQRLTNVDGTLFFSADDGTNGRELWKSDGTSGGTVMVKDIYTGRTYGYYASYPNSGSPTDLTNVNGTLFFAARNTSGNTELWQSDGSLGGTFQVRDIYSGGSSYPRYLTNVNGTLFFGAFTAEQGRELWKSDGTLV